MKYRRLFDHCYLYVKFLVNENPTKLSLNILSEDALKRYVKKIEYLKYDKEDSVGDFFRVVDVSFFRFKDSPDKKRGSKNKENHSTYK